MTASVNQCEELKKNTTKYDLEGELGKMSTNPYWVT